MTHGIRKGLEDVAYELKAIRHVLMSMWALQESESDSPQINPEMYADEYISTEECAKRLGVTDQTIRNWIAIGKNNTKPGGWIEGLHYVNVNPGTNVKGILRIPWNTLVRSFLKNPEITFRDYQKKYARYYRFHPECLDVYLKEYNAGLNTNAKEEAADSPPV